MGSDADRMFPFYERGFLRPKSPATPKSSASSSYKLRSHLQSNAEVAENKIITRNEISPGVFYGSPFGKPSKRPPHVARLLNEIRADISTHSKDTGSEAVWVTFPKQDQALQYADSHGSKELAIFTYQDHISGQRRFLATTYAEFWRRYSTMPPERRHHYEIIRQGAPCHLYFDVEFNRIFNPAANGEIMIDLLLQVVASAFRDIYSISYESSWTLELDSSTTEKFSRHLIIRIPKAVFQNNGHTGSFVAEVRNRIARLRESDEAFAELYVIQGDSRDTHESRLFVDEAVYSRNRSFRLVFSSKAGKSAVLLPTDRLWCSNNNMADEATIFLKSLICNVDAACETLLTFGEEGGGAGRLPFQVSRRSAVEGEAFGTVSSGASPFPAVDAFMESISCVGNKCGRIRSWYWFEEYSVLVYNIFGNRFCERIGREHKSNNVMYIVDFRTAGYYQKCHDPDCTGYKSPLRPIPRHTIPPQFPFSQQPLQSQLTSQLPQSQLSQSQSQSEDEQWWEEVIASMANVDFARSS